MTNITGNISMIRVKEENIYIYVQNLSNRYYTKYVNNNKEYRVERNNEKLK